ncbi:MAG: alpha/beta hydrolase [Clostridia bacterium]|nr:alpha/beta hydrolase [Clostridia bacterium]MDE7328907.1 alpha/beta hydrolase [Clostridia bacterium]
MSEDREVKKQEKKNKRLLKKWKINTSKVAKILFDLDDTTKSCVTNKYKSSNKILTDRDVVYCAEESDICKLDIFKPELVVDAKMPVLINVHGGGWITGDKKWRVAQGHLFADMGMTVININYGLCPKYKYHESIRHVVKAMHWVENNAEEYNLDLDNVFLMGDSAGGQIACLICAVLHNQAFLDKIGEKRVNYQIKGALLHCGAYDFEDMLQNSLAYDIIYDMTGKQHDQIDDYEYKDMMYTIPWIDADFPQRVFVAYGKNDVFVGRHHLPLLARLKELGKDVVEYKGTFPGVHCFHLYYKTRESRRMYRAEKQYLMEVVRNRFPKDIESSADENTAATNDGDAVKSLSEAKDSQE